MEVVIVGAGPAGLSAAVAAREAGADVRLLDAADDTGGQFWRHLPESRPSARERVLHHDWDEYCALRDRLRSDPRVSIETGAQVWALETVPGATVLRVLHGPSDGERRRSETIRTDRLVLATGAHDRALPVPGWTLPGVFTAGAAQALAKGERVAVGERVVVAGSGPFLLPVSVSLAQTGARVVEVVDAAGLRHLAGSWLRRPTELLGARGKVAELSGYVRHHLRRRVPWRAGQAVVEIHGEQTVTAVTIARVDRDWRPVPGTARRVECDAVCLGHGFVPRLELAVAAGCRMSPDRFVEVDECQQTSVPGVYAAGELTGIGGADLSRAEGRIAGWSAAGGAPGAAELAPARRARSTYTAFARRLALAHAVGRSWSAWLDDDTLVCRCEEVPYGQLRDVAAATEASGLRSIKLTTRACLGPCQGRICGRTVEDLLGDRLVVEDAGTDRRPVAAPIRLGELAAIHQDADGPDLPRKEEPTP